MNHDQRVIMIGGSSNVGKTAVAGEIADRLGWRQRSTDYLARHPGRPWQPKPHTVPAHVADHYLGLSTEALIESVLAHYQNVWPLIESLIREFAEARDSGLVLEGSAVWPANVPSLRLPRVSAIWLTASDEVFRTRILRESQYALADQLGKKMVDKFLERTLSFNRLMIKEVLRLGLPYLVVEHGVAVETVADLCLSQMRSPYSI
jgi:2-phosphoglycerate kinase